MSQTFDKENLQTGIALTNKALEMLKQSTGDTQSFLKGVKHAIAALYSIPRAFGMDEPPLYTVDLALGDGKEVKPEKLQINKTYILEDKRAYHVTKIQQYVIYIGKDVSNKYKFVTIYKVGGLTNPEILPRNNNNNIAINTNPRFSNIMNRFETPTLTLSYTLPNSNITIYSIKQTDSSLSGSLTYTGKGGRRRTCQKRAKRRVTTHKRKRI